MTQFSSTASHAAQTTQLHQSLQDQDQSHNALRSAHDAEVTQLKEKYASVRLIRSLMNFTCECCGLQTISEMKTVILELSQSSAQKAVWRLETICAMLKLLLDFA